MKSFGLTDKGSVRSINQDCFIIEKCPKASATIIALCDGMGGANAGDIASQLSTKAFVDYVFARLTTRSRSKENYTHILTGACEEANGVAFEYSRFDDAFEGMGTTIVGGVLKDNGEVTLLNVGDSRAYLISKRNETILQITKDHSYVEALVEAGAITREQAKIHPQKNLITRALGSEKYVQSDVYSLKLKKDEILLLCSDGLSNTISDDEIMDYSLACKTPEDICQILMSLALERGASDNVTVVAAVK